MDAPTDTSTVRPPEGYLDLLQRPLFAHFATVASDGSPRVNPMWFLWDDEAGVLKLTPTNQRHNYRYLQKNNKVALSIVMISAIHLLRAFMNDAGTEHLMVLSGVHAVFVLSALALAFVDRIGKSSGGH